MILHAGDVTTASVLGELGRLAPVEAVCGNVDEPALQELLPATRVVQAGRVRIGMVHDAGRAAGREERLLALFPGCAAIVYGHTHRPQLERRGSVWILNPGSPTERRREPVRTMIELEVVDGAVRPVLVDLS
jgi:uncharacterized protein